MIGFTVVTAPLLAALALALYNVDGMVKHSQSAIYDASQAVQLGRQLATELTEMERYARQFLILGDEDVFELYLEEHEEFIKITTDFQQLLLGQKQTQLLSQITSIEQNLYSWLPDSVQGKESSTQASEYFQHLSSLSQRLILESSRNIQDRLDSIQHEAETTKNLLVWQSMALIPAAFIIALIFTFLITKPLRQVGHSIRHLGSGNFDIPIKISGSRDVEELGKHLDWLRNRLADLEAQKTSVLRHISHDLKTPLTALREGTELLADNTLGTLNQQQTEIASILQTNCLKLQKQVEDLLSFGASQHQLEAHSRETIEVPSLLHEVATAHKLAIQSKGLTLIGHLANCEVVGDPMQLRVIFDNLFSNAIKYSPDKGEITVILTTQGSRMILDMQDQGPGIDPLDKDWLFDPYYQGKVTSQGPVKGTGLGLAIAQEFARLHKGIIEVISQSVGAHFRLTLPMEN